MYQEIKKCRICGNTNLDPILSLGKQYLTGVFPRSMDEQITCGPLELVKCREDESGNTCGLLQLKHSYDLNEMYGMNYGYRSGLNKSMVKHLHDKVNKILEFVELKEDDIVVDIGSNDSTLLQGYPQVGQILVGMDPTGKKFKEYYPDYVRLIPEFFSSEFFKHKFDDRKAKVVTSIAMFYDLEAPIEFMKQVYEILADDGVWVFEQSYMPTMLKENAYDTICHEHLEYYGFKQIKWMADRAGLKILDVEFNKVNGGSFSIMCARKESSYPEKTELIDQILTKEKENGLSTMKPYEEFKTRVFEHKDQLLTLLEQIKSENKTVVGYGASTKGNVILQLCNITKEDMGMIAEVNVDKFGRLTPGTGIPIVSEAEAKASNPDYMLVLPWHFKDNILKREEEYINNGGKMLFPLPKIEVVKNEESLNCR